tara:strand:- start:2555 stop:2716 length:162 start_codon:yes stop_codon:yes gene_type:complete
VAEQVDRLAAGQVATVGQAAAEQAGTLTMVDRGDGITSSLAPERVVVAAAAER